MRVCHSRYSVSGSGSRVASTVVASTVAASTVALACQLVTPRSHSSGSSASTASLARTSSPRLVSWVDRVVIVAGQSRPRRAAKAWNAAGLTPSRAGSAPTSFMATSRDHR